jgi:hypothetical protein
VTINRRRSQNCSLWRISLGTALYLTWRSRSGDTTCITTLSGEWWGEIEVSFKYPQGKEQEIWYRSEPMFSHSITGRWDEKHTDVTTHRNSSIYVIMSYLSWQNAHVRSTSASWKKTQKTTDVCSTIASWNKTQETTDVRSTRASWNKTQETTDVRSTRASWNKTQKTTDACSTRASWNQIQKKTLMVFENQYKSSETDIC